MPPTENRGRVHTSTVTVAVFEAEKEKQYELDMSEVTIRTTRGTGNGGQHKQKNDTCVIATHEPTGLTAKCDSREQSRNKKEALKELSKRVHEFYKALDTREIEKDRQEQVGSGMRGDKIRTYREKDDRVKDHRTKRATSLKNVLKGKLEKLWN